MVLYILNSPVLTDFGTYTYRTVSLTEARKLVSQPFVSAVGHEGTARFLSLLLLKEIPTNRTKIQMKPGDTALVIQILTRLPEGRVLNLEELFTTPYLLGLLTFKSYET